MAYLNLVRVELLRDYSLAIHSVLEDFVYIASSTALVFKEPGDVHQLLLAHKGQAFVLYAGVGLQCTHLRQRHTTHTHTHGRL